MTDAEKRRAFVRRIVQNEALEDIYSDDRSEQWNAFSPAEKKKINESKVFVRFVIASGLAGDPYDHDNEDPPLPDIRWKSGGQTYYFELGEITDEGLARAVSISEKSGEITGSAFSQLDPLLKMFRDKCAKPYATNGAPVDLLLYYSKQYPLGKFLHGSLKSYEAEITQLIRQGPFSRIWIYTDWPPRKVLWQAAR